jgi:transposase-like protein
MNTENYPKTLMQAVQYFADLDRAQDFFVQIRWPDGVTCPTCGSKDVHYLANQRRWKCRSEHPRRQFSAKVGTLFEDSPLGLDKWLVAVWLEVNAKNSISSYELHRALGITQKSAWFMLHRVRLALKRGSFEKIGGQNRIVEADETYVGGKSHFMSDSRRAKTIKGGGSAGKAIVMGLLERKGSRNPLSRVIAKVIPQPDAANIHGTIYDNVKDYSKIYTDALPIYKALGTRFQHDFVDHTVEYVKGNVSTQGIDNFWALFKRCLKGTHVSVDPVHLQAYLDSEIFRFNERGLNDGGRFVLALQGLPGKRLTYKALIGALELPMQTPETRQA